MRGSSAGNGMKSFEWACVLCLWLLVALMVILFSRRVEARVIDYQEDQNIKLILQALEVLQVAPENLSDKTYETLNTYLLQIQVAEKPSSFTEPITYGLRVDTEGNWIITSP